MSGGGQVVELRPVLAADLDHVAEALGGDQRGARPGPLEQGVGGHRHAVGEGLGLLDPRGPQGGHHPLGLVTGRRGHLAGHQAPA
jgi:hypothetical protein